MNSEIDDQTALPELAAGEAADRGILQERAITIWVPSEELWRDLEAAAGLPEYWLGRYKEWNALGPRHFSEPEDDLDAFIAWARAHGIPYTEERAVHYRGSIGVVDHTTERLVLNPAGRTEPGPTPSITSTTR